MGDKCEDNIEVQIDEEYIEESSEGNNDLFDIIIFITFSFNNLLFI